MASERKAGETQFTGRCGAKFYISLAPRGPVAQGIEQQPSKLKVAGSNPAGVANHFKDLRRRKLVGQMAGEDLLRRQRPRRLITCTPRDGDVIGVTDTPQAVVPLLVLADRDFLVGRFRLDLPAQSAGRSPRAIHRAIHMAAWGCAAGRDGADADSVDVAVPLQMMLSLEGVRCRAESLAPTSARKFRTSRGEGTLRTGRQRKTGQCRGGRQCKRARRLKISSRLSQSKGRKAISTPPS